MVRELSLNNLSQTIIRWCEMIKIEHTVFALPFALSGFILASGSRIALAKLCWAIIAFLAARSSAMSLNRAIDAKIDALNPRTLTRAIPQGQIKVSNALKFAFLAFLLMVYAAYNLNWTCVMLSPIAIIWLSLYSYTKRFTYLCHFVLGLSLGGAALGGYVAVSNSLTNLTPWCLALAVSLWVSGFDILYALQDYEFDRQHKIYSLPARFGVERALLVAKIAHVFTIICLILTGIFAQIHFLYYIGIGIVALMLIYEHSLVKPHDLSKINQAFFNINGFVSIICFTCILLDHFLL